MLQRFFSDETEAFRSPAEPGINQWVTVRLRVEAGLEVQAALLVGKGPNRIPMVRTHADALFSWYEARFRCGLEPLTYRIAIDCGAGSGSGMGRVSMLRLDDNEVFYADIFPGE